MNHPWSCTVHGSLIIYLKDDYTYTERQLPKHSELWESLFIDIDHDGLKNNIILAYIYI